MFCMPNWKWKVIVALIIYVTYCQALEQEIGEDCTNKNGIVGLCQLKHKCSNVNNLGVICNSEKSIICCAKNILKNKQNFNSSNDQKEDESVQSRFGFIPDFFHAPISFQNSKPNVDFFNDQNSKHPDLVGNTYHHSLNTATFVDNRPIQNVDQYSSMFDRDHTTKRPQNNNDRYETQKQNKNSNNNYPNFQSTHHGIPNYITQKPNRNQNENFNRPNYETQRPNKNSNNNYPEYQSTHGGIPNYITQRPNRNQNENFNRPNHEAYMENQNYNNYNYFLNSNQQSGNNQLNHAPYESNQNNNFNKNPNYHTSTQKPQNNDRTTNSYEYEDNRRPNQNMNHYPDTSNVVFPASPTDDKSYTIFTTTTKRYEHQNRPYENVNTKRISEIKCEEYSKPLTSTISALPLQLNTVPKPVPIEKCSSKSVELIVGGTKAELGEFPHMVAIGFNTTSENPFSCGGTLISERFVLTAAHCSHSALGKPIKVRLGELNLQNNNDGANPIDISVDDIIIHPNYIPTSKYNDIALIRLAQIVKFNNHIRPACLYNNDNIYSTRVTATGWGSIAYGDRSSEDLLKVDLDIIDKQTCSKLYEDESKKKTLNKGIVDSMVCAGYLTGGYDTCLGDSGGPLVIRSEKNACVFNLIGVTSFGKFCATENSPGVYTKVSAFVPWIEQIVWS